MLGAVGGRLGAFREADSDPVKLDEAILRNCYRNESVDPAAFGHVRTALQDVIKALAAQSSAQIVSGDAAW
jgi:cytochrome b pre-mRNA-processing protein 3